MRIDFHGSPRPTLGVEWELALVDRETRDLANRAHEVLETARGRMDDPKLLHAELLRNTVEIVSGVSSSVAEAMADVDGTRRAVATAAAEHSCDLFGAGTHPFASWSTQLLSPGHRYEELINRTQWWGRQMLIWGVHVHVGLPVKERVMHVLSAMLTYYPHLQALSASSPLWAGTDTGYASNRALMFQQLPTAGLPFQFERWEEFEAFAHDQLTTGVIDDLSEIRWDVRPACHLGTLENRIADGVSNLTELAALTALTHCLVVDLDERIAAGERPAVLPPWHVQENKWRTARYGLDAIIILDARSRERLVTDDLDDLLERLEPVARRLECVDELRSVADIARRGASYQRQRAVAAATGGDLVAVVDSVVREQRDGLAPPDATR
ncbi:glutamate--cysteine ligase [Nocardioides zeae]|uniref:Putative glutamate--cysteine ligase 2 n=1 Tax=Nocardioides imazamoxiresistens TaxID=3231893 RepID=A0ABU3PYV7_9ACTN|nr:glutamate--cysteine ligase [Nocardioides zeae]MDT9593955.1 glutamate--cysteine ligase [Nocardioides zeae]